jgi:ANTAR domain-containing protein
VTEERVYDADLRGRGEGQRLALSRATNERIAQIAADAACPGPLSILCECADDRCFEQIEINDSDYAAIRRTARRFVLKPGHTIAALEQVLAQRDGYVVVERGGETGTDPAPKLHPVDAGPPGDGRRSGAPEASSSRPQVDAVAAELDEARTRSEQLEHALRSRIVIEQAKGILAERFGLSIENAFEVLRYAARSARTNIHQLAHDVVTGKATPKPTTKTSARNNRRHRAASPRTQTPR